MKNESQEKAHLSVSLTSRLKQEGICEIIENTADLEERNPSGLYDKNYKHCRRHQLSVTSFQVTWHNSMLTGWCGSSPAAIGTRNSPWHRSKLSCRQSHFHFFPQHLSCWGKLKDRLKQTKQTDDQKIRGKTYSISDRLFAITMKKHIPKLLSRKKIYISLSNIHNFQDVQVLYFYF